MANPFEKYVAPPQTASPGSPSPGNPFTRYAEPNLVGATAEMETDYTEGIKLALKERAETPGAYYAGGGPQRFISKIPFVGGAIDEVAAQIDGRMLPKFKSPAMAKGYYDQRSKDYGETWAGLPTDIASAIVGVGGIIGAGRALGGAAATGAEALAGGLGNTLGRQVRTSGVANAVLGGADAAVRTRGDVGDTAVGALLGGGIGAAAPIATKAIGAGYEAVRSRVAPKPAGVAGVPDDAIRAVERTIDEERIPLAQVAPRLQTLGDDAMLADLGPASQRTMTGAALLSGEAKAIADPRLLAREKTAPQRIARDLDALGPTVPPGQFKEITDNIRTQHVAPLYEQAWAQAVPVPVDPLVVTARQLARHESAPIVAELQRILNDITAEGAEASPQRLHSIKEYLDSLINYSPLPGADPTSHVLSRSSALRQMRGAINEYLEATVPLYAEANAAYRAGVGQPREAYRLGQQEVLRTGPNAIAPGDLSRVRAQHQAPADRALQMGTRQEIDRRITGTPMADRTALRRTVTEDDSWNKDKLRQVFGPWAVDTVERGMKREEVFSATERALLHNSQTAPRAEAVKSIKEWIARPGLVGAIGGGTGLAAGLATGNPLMGLVAGATAGGMTKAGKAIGERLAAARERRIAPAIADLMTRRGPEREAIIQALVERAQGVVRGRVQRQGIEAALRGKGRTGATPVLALLMQTPEMAQALLEALRASSAPPALPAR